MDGRRVAVVTGAAHGIGLATARRLADRGLAVAAVDADGDGLAAAPLPDGVLRVTADVAESPGRWLADVHARLGLPTVLVNNAAGSAGRPFLRLSMEEVRRSFDVTLFGTWALTRQVVDDLLEAGEGGSVVVVLSLHSRRVRMSPDYSAGKAALRMLVRELADELGPHGIRVNAVSPGAIDTWSHRSPDGPARRDRSAALVPLGRLGEPDDVARAIAYLADPEASPYVTGADLVVDGGLDGFNWMHHLDGRPDPGHDRTL